MNRGIIAIFVLFFSVESPLTADIAPTNYIGSGIEPAEDCDIRLVTAKVEIDWGTPCNLAATFVLDNETKDSKEVKLSFPIDMPCELYSKYSDSFTIAFDDSPLDDAKIITKIPPEESFEETIWIQCSHNFKPGKTVVAIKTKILPSLVSGWPYRENIFYRIQTGSLWKGTIEKEEVTINFPYPVSQQQIIEIAPSNFEIKGKSVQWKFEDFEPHSNEYDISLHYIRPDVFKKLSELREKHSKDPENTALTIKLAKHLFALGCYKGYAGYPPSTLNRNQFNDILEKLEDRKKKKFFKSRYSLSKDGVYKEIDSEWSFDREYLVEILSEIDYEPAYWKSRHVTEAKELIENLLEKQPANAEAWNVYLANYYRFRFAGTPPDSYLPVIYEHQKNIISKAYQQCPSDLCIILWYAMCESNRENTYLGHPVYMEENLLVKRLKESGIYDLEYTELDYAYY